MITKPQLSEILIRQFNIEDQRAVNILIAHLSGLTDKGIIKEAQRSGLTVTRLRAGEFTLSEIS